jgi:hypothetical protein
VAAACIVAAAAPSIGQDVEQDETPFDRDCMDDYGRDLCQLEKWSEIVASFDLEPAEVVQSQGWRGVRVFTIDGYSQDMPMVSVLHKERSQYGEIRDPQLEVRGPRRGTEPAPVLKRAAWRALAWEADGIARLVSDAPVRQSDRQQDDTAVPAGEEEEITICLHAWVTVTEALTDDGVIRRIRNACGEDPLFDAGYDLSGLALRGFPHCNHLDPDAYRNESTQLRHCLTVSGNDLVAGADLLRHAGEVPYEDYRTGATAAQWRAWLGDGHAARLDWGGRTVLEPEADAARFLAEQEAALGRHDVFQARVIGIGPARGMITGEVAYRIDPDGDRHQYMRADYEQTWIRFPDGKWRLDSWTVQPFTMLDLTDE